MRSCGLILLLVLLFIPWQGRAMDDAGSFLEKNVVVRKLDNGITVVMLNRGYSPTLAFQISFLVGSSDESYTTCGAAHLLEHMLFKGTDTIGTTDWKAEKKLLDRIEAAGEKLDSLRSSNPADPGIPALERDLAALEKEASRYVVNAPYDRLYSENGGVGFNATTSRDMTEYYIQLPSDKIELWARLESERLRNPVFREYYTERANVMEERLMRTDASGTGLLFERFMSASFQANPYRHPTIGWASSIPALNMADVRRFYKTYYIPSRMTVTIVGKQDIEKTYRVVRKYFSKLPAAPAPRINQLKEPPGRGETRFEIFFESSPELMVGWHKPPFPSPDDTACDVMARLLGTGRSSRLYRALVLEKKVASTINVWSGMPGDRAGNLFMIHAEPADGITVDELEKAIYAELEKLSTVTVEEIVRVRNSIESEMIFGLSSSEGVADLLAYYQTLAGDWRVVLEYLERVRNIGPEDIYRVAAKYLVRNNRTVGILRDSRMEAVK